MARSTFKTNDDTKANKANEAKWTTRNWEPGWTAVPSALLRGQARLGLQPIDLAIILNLVSFWWEAGNNPFPSKERLAKAIGVDAKTIQRRIAAMEKRGYVARDQRRGPEGSQTNRYDLAGLVKALHPYADELRKERDDRKAAKSASVTRQRRGLRLVSR